jgi:glycosyltransferase involved in cell wall biosynthesis
MRILVASTQVPFVYGGGEALAQNLMTALRVAGHQVDLFSVPFFRTPVSELNRLIDFHLEMPLDSLWQKADQVISLRFPAFYIPHAKHSIWVLHQFREAMELFSWAYPNATRAERAMQRRVRRLDTEIFARTEAKYTISKLVSKRALASTGQTLPALYHPPPEADQIYPGDYLDYIFAPSRLEEIKRQHLLIEAMRYVKTPVKAVIAGDGSHRQKLQAQIDFLNLRDKVVLTGAISREEMLGYYAHCLGVFFAPRDEDYGYITLEAMLAKKAVITAIDSGGPNEFVLHEETGFVCEPSAVQFADAIDRLYVQRALARDMGEAGHLHYQRSDITWQSVVDHLVLP